MGTKYDTGRREKLAREDDNSFRSKIRSARRAIYELGKGVKSTAVENILANESLVPTSVRLIKFPGICCQNRSRLTNGDTQNAFSEFAASIIPFNFNFFSMFVVDLMHEFELGVWKAIFIHLIRIIFSLGNGAMQEFNNRYVFSHTSRAMFSLTRVDHQLTGTVKSLRLAGRLFVGFLPTSPP